MGKEHFLKSYASARRLSCLENLGYTFCRLEFGENGQRDGLDETDAEVARAPIAAQEGLGGHGKQEGMSMEIEALFAGQIQCYDNIGMSETVRGLRQVARLAGVSVMTVSRVMRNSALVRPETARLVLIAAEKIGYRPDPVASRLMAVVRKGKKTEMRASLAFVRDRRKQLRWENEFHQYVRLEDLRLRAEVHGYGVDEFSLGEDGLTPAHLQAILQARGIEGVLFSPEASQTDVKGFDFSRFASVTFGYGLREPSLHRASTNMMQGLLTVFGWLEQRGYERIGLAVTPWVNDRSDHTYSGAMLNYQTGISRRRRVPQLIFPLDRLVENRRAFGRWVREHRPDAIISFDRLIPDWIQEETGRRISEDIGFVVHDWTERAGNFSGINHNRTHVVAAAVDLVATQLFHGEQGIPMVPRQVLIPATLVDRGSCPQRV